MLIIIYERIGINIVLSISNNLSNNKITSLDFGSVGIVIKNELINNNDEHESDSDKEYDLKSVSMKAFETVFFTYLIYHVSDRSNSLGHSYIRNVVNIYEGYLSITDVRNKLKAFLINDVKIKIIEILSKKSLNFVRYILPSIYNIFELIDVDICPYLRKTLSTMAFKSENNDFF
uniref:RNase III domain-containing protein n=1 Tax=Strongyloides stercoralis TaxID=6248 RepID=A0A0K0E6U0_STRER